jgi:hypothetical protein
MKQHRDRIFLVEVVNCTTKEEMVRTNFGAETGLNLTDDEIWELYIGGSRVPPTSEVRIAALLLMIGGGVAWCSYQLL